MHVLLQTTDGTFWLVNYAAGTKWRARGGLQLDVIRKDARLLVLKGTQPPTLVDGLREVGA
jgi:hypothetical protein